MDRKPKIFIGSSSENLEQAERFQIELSALAAPDLWNSVFPPGSYTLDTLLEIAGNYDFAVFLLMPNDLATLRESEYSVARDNVVFEAGLFFGHLGRSRTFIVAPDRIQDGPKVHLPSDLSGLNVVMYSGVDAEQGAEFGYSTAAAVIKQRIRKLGLRETVVLDHIVRSLSGGLVYVLRHVAKRATNLDEVTAILSGMDDNTNLLIAKKTAKYAVLVLNSLKLVNTNSDEVTITGLGEQFLSFDAARKTYPREFRKKLLAGFK